MWVAFANAHFFSKKISIYAIFSDQRFNDTLTNAIVCFEQLGPELKIKKSAILIWSYDVLSGFEMEE